MSYNDSCGTYTDQSPDANRQQCGWPHLQTSGDKKRYAWKEAIQSAYTTQDRQKKCILRLQLQIFKIWGIWPQPTPYFMAAEAESRKFWAASISCTHPHSPHRRQVSGHLLADLSSAGDLKATDQWCHLETYASGLECSQVCLEKVPVLFSSYYNKSLEFWLISLLEN